MERGRGVTAYFPNAAARDNEPIDGPRFRGRPGFVPAPVLHLFIFHCTTARRSRAFTSVGDTSASPRSRRRVVNTSDVRGSIRARAWTSGGRSLLTEPHEDKTRTLHSWSLYSALTRGKYTFRSYPPQCFILFTDCKPSVFSTSSSCTCSESLLRLTVTSTGSTVGAAQGQNCFILS